MNIYKNIKYRKIKLNFFVLLTHKIRTCPREGMVDWNGSPPDAYIYIYMLIKSAKSTF